MAETEEDRDRVHKLETETGEELLSEMLERVQLAANAPVLTGVNDDEDDDDVPSGETGKE